VRARLTGVRHWDRRSCGRWRSGAHLGCENASGRCARTGTPARGARQSRTEVQSKCLRAAASSRGGGRSDLHAQARAVEKRPALGACGTCDEPAHEPGLPRRKLSGEAVASRERAQEIGTSCTRCWNARTLLMSTVRGVFLKREAAAAALTEDDTRPRAPTARQRAPPASNGRRTECGATVSRVSRCLACGRGLVRGTSIYFSTGRTGASPWLISDGRAAAQNVARQRRAVLAQCALYAWGLRRFA